MTEMPQSHFALPVSESPVSGPVPVRRRAAGQADLPLSFAQEQVWFIDEFNNESPMHNVPKLVRLRGPLDVAALDRAVNGLIARHEVLRTRLPAGADGRPVQVIDPLVPVQLECADYAELGREAALQRLREFATADASRPFDLAHDQLFRGSLVRLAADEHVLVIVAHQTVLDDWSFGLLLRELAALYRQEANGEPSGLAELPVHFADYALWERQRLQGAVLADLEDYWRGALAGLQTSQFPTDRPRPLLASHAGAVEITRTDPGLLDDLRELSRREGTTLPVTLLAALQVLVSRHTGQTDVVVGMASANRMRPELAGLAGFLANTLPIRADLSGDPTFTEFLGRLREAAEGASAHQDLPFAKVVEVLHLDRDTGRWPVFQIGFGYTEPTADIESAGVVFRSGHVELLASKYDIGFVAEACSDGLRFEATYTTALFDAGTVRRLLGNFEVLLAGVVADPGARVSELPVLTAGELHRELVEWNDTAADFPRVCVHEGFEAQVARTPDAVAAEFEGERVSYGELNRWANRIARRLRGAGAGPEALVGVCMQAGLRRLAGLLGVWKAGGGYVPLDPALPSKRLAFMIADTGMSVVLADEPSVASLPAGGGVAVVSLDAEWEQVSGLDGANLAESGVMPSDVAYVIYTSGSTGEPKGVVVEHRQAVNFLQGMVGHWRIGPVSVVLQFAAFTFDVSVMDMFMPLLAGGRVVLAAPGTLHSPPRLAGLIREAGVTFACLPPAVLSVLTGEDFPGLRILLSAGEELSSDLLRAWLRPGLEIYNGYGPTEASIGATFMRLDASTQLPPPIGRPKPNYRVYVLDGFLNPVPVGVTGELHIGGAGVARGYLNRPELTGQKFVPDPFAPAGRLYKTGDLVRRRADGTIVFLGRADDQVKIRGLRVELGEIEAALVAHPDVAQAVVTVVTDPAGEQHLAAYLRAGKGREAAIAEIRQHLGRHLPGYMIPTYLLVLAEFPLTINGKIDKAALPAPQVIQARMHQAGVGPVPPRTLLETLLVAIYATVLGNEQLGVTDSFFDVGGSSLQAMQLITQLRTTLAVDLDVAAVFLAPTPRQLAALLRDKHGLDDEDLGEDGTEGAFASAASRQDGDAGMLTGSQRAALVARLRRGRESKASQIPRRPAGLTDLPPSHGQEQLWFIDRFAPGESAYNIPHAVALSGPLDVAALGRALDGLVARHEALRTRLVANAEGRPVQVIDPPGPSPLEVVDLSGIEPEKRQVRLREFVDTEALRPFTLAAGPLLRTWLLRLADDEHVLTVVVHHVVFDGWSAGVLLQELAALYRQEARGEPSGLAELPVQFADYALWERDRLQGTALQEAEDYWQEVMHGFETVTFPTDRPHPVLDNFDGGIAKRMTSRGLLDELRELSRREGTTPFVILMAALQALLHRYTGQTDLVVGTVSANRTRPELGSLIGFLVNTLPIRADLSGDPVFTELLARVGETIVGAYAHQDLPFGKLVDTLRVERDPSRAPVFQIALVYAERDSTPVCAAGVEFAITDLIVGVNAAKFDLTILAEARSDGLRFECSYKSGLFDAGTVRRLLGNFEVLLAGVVADPGARVSELPVLTAGELHRELVEWNDTAADFPRVCVHEGFEAQVARTPDAVAAEFEGERVSYAELNRWANRIARRLRGAGAGPEVLVGVCMQAGLRRLAGLLGVWKAGGGYVPLDPALPSERLSFMIADTGMSVVLTDEPSAGSVPAGDGVTVVSLDAEWEQVSGLDGADLADAGVVPSNVAYVIYTSGSTGEPKGVVVEHRQAVNFLLGMVGHWRIGPASVVLQFAAFTFDVSVMDMFMPLLGGARVVLASVQTLHSPPRLAALMREAGVTFACLPPAVLSLLGDEQFPDLHVLMAAGEELPSELARRWVRPGLRFVNGYGPTEATVIATYQELDVGMSPPPIGKPTWPNYRVYVLDAHLNPVPAGVVGELHIGGPSVARGYLNRPELTRERFIPDPFAPGQRLYKTGDLVRRRPDGAIVFIGRVDSQVKIRGLRVELGEIEAALVAHPDVAQAVVTVVTDPAGEQQLAAYLRPEPGVARAGGEELRDHLARMLPGYMIPTYLITVDGFPLNASGKIDKAALPAPEPRSSAGQVAPGTLIETMMVDMYATLLGREQVGATDSFFDLGGNSLQAMRLISMMDSDLEMDIGVAAVFLAPTPRQLAALLRDKHGLQDAELGADGIEGLEQLTDEEPGTSMAGVE